MSTTIKVKCIDQTLTYEGTPTVASGGVNEDYVQFEFCSQWDGYSKVAVFYQNKGEIYYSLVSTENIAVIPKEVIATKGIMYLGVIGVKDNVTRTSKVLEYRIENGALDGFTPVEPTPEIYQQILTELQAIRDLSAETLSNEQAFEKAITEQQSSYETDLNNQWSTYKTNLNGEWSTYKTDLTKQQADYETKITNQQTTFESTVTEENTTFTNNVNEKLTTYENNVESIAEESANNAISKAQNMRTITLGTSWSYDSTNNYYTQSVDVVGIKSTDKPVIDVVTSGTASNIKSQQKEWSKVLQVETYDGVIEFYAKSATTTTLTITVKPDLSKVTINNVSSEEAGLDKLQDEVKQNTNDIATNTANITKKQDTLISGTNIKTIGNQSLLGSGDIALFNNVYSTDEQVVGTWLDGKKIYRKVLAQNATIINAEYKVDVSSLNIKAILHAGGFVIGDNKLLPYSNPWMSIYFGYENNTFGAFAYNSSSEGFSGINVTFWIEYIKTTD